MKNTKTRNALLLLSIAISGCGTAGYGTVDAAPVPRQVVWLEVNKPVPYQSTKIYRFAASAKRNYKVALSPTGTASLKATSTGATATTTICAQNTTVAVSVSGTASGQIALSAPSAC